VDRNWRVQAIAYFRRIANGGPDDDAEWSGVVEFFSSHGISFEWVVFGNAGPMVCGAAARSRQATQPPSSPRLRLVVGGQPNA
jgi:hypothetical protein